MEITRTVETTAPIESVYAYLSDFTTTNEWDPGTVKTTRLSGNGGIGTTYKNVSKFRGRTTELEYKVTELVPMQRFVLRGTNKTIDATDTMRFAVLPNGGTQVVYNANFEFKGVTKLVLPLITPILGKAFKTLGDEAEQGMRQALTKLGG